ncbi:MAG: phage tail assembly protein [Anaerolineae bacterium]|jgi:hypothetical protein
MQTEFLFRLPLGYQDGSGQVHREGAMRLATAIDEIVPLGDARVRANEAYLSVLLLARVVTRLGSLSAVTPEVIEGLFSADLAYLQALYRQINQTGGPVVEAVCPHCGRAFEATLALPEA